jgi:2-oxopent-4-enoate/cis-2-oxohex-4-enoate hydratase
MSTPTINHTSLIEQYANALFQALEHRSTITPITAEQTSFTIDDAYQISLRFLALRQAQGETIIGKKIGVTSKAVQEMLNVHQPDFGFLTHSMHYPEGAAVSFAQAKLIQPRAEAEIAFKLNADLQGPGITLEDVIAATEWVAPCFEIVDSRIDNWQIQIVDTVADNASCGVFVIGDHKVDPRNLDLAAAAMQMWHNGQPAGSGLGSAVQGHPAQAVAWLANTLGAYGITLNRGDVILSGALAPLVPVTPGDEFTMEIAGMGSCSIAFTE